MSCEDCEKAQTTLLNAFYMRIGTANLLMFGCPKHLKELQTIVRHKMGDMRDNVNDIYGDPEGSDITQNWTNSKADNAPYWDCPECGEPQEIETHPAYSRKDNETEICPNCGTREGLSDWFANKREEKKDERSN